MTEETIRLRPMLVGDVARAARIPRETLRVWLRRDIFSFPKSEDGWRRFTDFEAISICIFAALMRGTPDHEMAKVGMLLSSKLLIDEWKEDEAGVPYFAISTFERDRFLLFWRRTGEDWTKGNWNCEIAAAGQAFEREFNLRMQESDTEAPVFSVVNLGAILKHTLIALLKVQIDIHPDNSSKKGDK